MKKMLVLAFSLGIITTVFAQNGYSKDRRDESRDVVFGNSTRPRAENNRDYRNDSYSFTARERDAQIARINREFDYKIMAVKRDRYLRNGEKNRRIRILERERTEQIRQVNKRWSSQKPFRYNDHKDRNYGKRY